MTTSSNTVTEIREVTPQWASTLPGKGAGNLGTHKVKVVPFTAESIRAIMEKRAADVADVMNAQCSIKFLGPAFVKLVTQCVRSRAEGEKLDAFREATIVEARDAAKDVASETFDFLALFEEWASTERGTKGKLVLVNYDGILANVMERWTTASDEKKVQRLKGLAIELPVTATAGEVCEAIKAKYKPAVVVTADDMM